MSQDPAGTRSGGSHGGRRPVRICYVDDSRTSAFVMKRMLQQRGYDVEHFWSAEPAFVALIQNDFDLLISDLRVSSSGMDGDDLVRAMRNSGSALSRMPVLIITSASDPAVVERILRDGADALLTKPPAIERLDAEIRRLLHLPETGDASIDVAQPAPAVVDAPTLSVQPTAERASVPPSATPPELVPLSVALATEIDTPGHTAAGQTETLATAEESVAANDAADVEFTPEPEPAAQQTGDVLWPLKQYPLQRIENVRPSPLAAIRVWLGRAQNAFADLPLAWRGGLLALIPLIVLLSIFGLDRRTPVTVISAERGEIYHAISASGRVVSQRMIDVTSAGGGRLTEVLVKEGDKVGKGQLLARLDNREALSEVKRAEARLASAREDVILADRSLKRLLLAFEKGAVARQVVEDAEVQLRSTQARQRVAQEELGATRLLVDSLRIVAPFPGTVTARFAEVGQWADSSSKLFTIVDESQREVELRVDAADSSAITNGQLVQMASDAYPGQVWHEYVARVGTAAGADNSANSVRVFVSLGEDAPPLRFGQQVDGEIRTSWNPVAIKLPFAAVFTREEAHYAAVMNDGAVRYVPVTTGIADFTHHEIVSGVNFGDQVIVMGAEPLAEGTPVRDASH